MGYWEKRAVYKEDRDLKKVQFIRIFNKKTREWEKIRLRDYLNSFNLGEKKESEKNEIMQNYADSLIHEITKAQNMQNITGSADPDEKQFKKFLKYVDDWKKENEKGE